MVIGGGEVYRLFLDQADIVHRTRVHAMVDGDTNFPQLDGSLWELTCEELHDADESHAHAMTFETWTRR
jgi:dihydrofolate reductase